MALQFRTGLKKILPESVWPFFRWCDRYVVDITYIYLSKKRSKERHRLGLEHSFPQSIPCFSSLIDFDQEDGMLLESILTAEGLSCLSGRHSVYIRPEDVGRINDTITSRYPAKVGLKIIKGRQLSPDGTPYYTCSKLASASSKWSMEAVGNISEKKAVSNLLYLAGFAPGVLDIVKLESASGASHFAFIVEHVQGKVVHGPEGEAFIDRFKTQLTDFGMRTISIAEHCDLKPPEFRDNIMRGDSKTVYVDIQNFAIAETKLLDETFQELSRTLKSWEGNDFADLLPAAGHGLKSAFYRKISSDIFESMAELGIAIDRSVICTSRFGGVVLVPFALWAGSLWCHVRTDHNDPVVKWLYLNGFSRFSAGNGIENSSGCAEVAASKSNICILFKEDPAGELRSVDLFDYVITISRGSKDEHGPTVPELIDSFDKVMTKKVKGAIDNVAIIEIFKKKV